jgi:hypothetical protein
MMYEILRNAELTPKYIEHMDRIKAQIKAAEAEQTVETPKIIVDANS